MSEFLALFLLYGRLDATLDHLMGDTTSTPVLHSEVVLVGVGIFSIVISFMSLYKSLIINRDELNSLRVSSKWLSNSAHFRQI